MKALVIDDSPSVRVIIRKILQELGFEVLEANDGQDALDVLDEVQDVSLMLVDWNMPVMDGFTFIQTIRSNDAFNHVPLVMVTTETEMKKVVMALEAGANEYIMKPFSKDMILDKLKLLNVIES